MTIVAPTGVIDDRIQTQTFDRNTRRFRAARLLTNVTQPRRTRLAFDTSLRDENRPAISLIHFAQHLTHRPVQRVPGRQQSILTPSRWRSVWILMDPLVVRVVINADDVEVLRTPAEFGTRSEERRVGKECRAQW